MKKRVIAVDCDDVLVETVPYVVDSYNTRYGTTVRYTDFYGGELAPWGVSDVDTIIKRINSYLVTEEFLRRPPMADAVRVLRRLAQQHDLHVVTGRPHFVADATHDLLARHFTDVFQSTVFTNMYKLSNDVVARTRTKADVCRELGADVLIDDHLLHAKAVAKSGVEAILFGDYSWNQADVLPANIHRAKDWAAVLQYFDE